ncbi:2-dehydropantoate 2-reductase [Sphingomonas sp.]|uniref:ketopantoate reductase family protein n=1 Tax=Sphingomonas sp. TaxID=28214 RepID=UPI0025E0386D|nr:2-dehydropantoate 2-reductase [Sphingomonas sp.]MBV9528610.1 2-dehydropantoate 2-reductase [Sphingomonas sp.]
MDVCVVGAGAIGGWVAARLALAGHCVMAVNSGGPLGHLDVSEHGETKTAAFSHLDAPARLLVLAVKAPALPTAAAALGTVVGPDTIVLPMLNGVPWWFVESAPLRSVDPAGTVATALPLPQVVGCVVHASCYRDGPGRIVVKHADKLIVGEPRGGPSDRVAEVRELFEGAGIRCDASDNIRRAIWYKLWGNATINPLSALTRATADRILAQPECRAWMLEGMAELAAVGAAISCPITESGEDRIKVTERLGAFRTSMLQDVEAGRPIELEALLGAPREIARREGIPTPALDRLYGVTRLTAETLGLI